LTADPSLLGTDQFLSLDPNDDDVLTSYWCDLTDDDAYGPGWTLLYYSQFQQAGDNAGWGFWNSDTNAADDARAVVTTCGSASILGGYDQTSEGWLHRQFDAATIPHDEIHHRRGVLGHEAHLGLRERVPARGRHHPRPGAGQRVLRHRRLLGVDPLKGAPPRPGGGPGC
jgi:hypothetical protein